MRSLSAFTLTASLALACAAAGARAATLPAGFAESQIAVGLASPTAMAHAPDGRVFVCLQGGQLRVVKNGALLPTPFLALAVSSAGERGLLGVAFDPGFASNRFVYVYYTATTPTVHNRVSRFTASASNPDVAEAGSEVVVLDLETLSGATNHNGGAMHFGADGKLYVAVGENATPSHSQSYANKLGKILRVNTDPANLIPADNPFLSRTTGTNQAIWALGLRNPYTFAVQPGTGRILVNDVGQNAWEEINEGAAGANYGWPACEGNCPSPSPTPALRPPNTYTNPVFQYGHSGAPVTRLRFRIVQLSTPGSRADGEADLRALSSGDVTVSVAGSPFVLRGTTLEAPPAQAQGGGVNSTLSADSISLATPLQPNQSISLQLLFGVQAGGGFRFLVNVEAF